MAERGLGTGENTGLSNLKKGHVSVGIKSFLSKENIQTIMNDSKIAWLQQEAAALLDESELHKDFIVNQFEAYVSLTFS